MKNDHIAITIKCKDYEFTSDTVTGLKEHKEQQHVFKFNQCEWKVTSEEEITRHAEQVHGNKTTKNVDKIVLENQDNSVVVVEIEATSEENPSKADGGNCKETTLEMENK